MIPYTEGTIVIINSTTDLEFYPQVSDIPGVIIGGHRDCEGELVYTVEPFNDRPYGFPAKFVRYASPKEYPELYI